MYLAHNFDYEGRYLFLSAIANHLRYPNTHTHYFSCVLLYLFADTNDEVVREQITRVLLERLIADHVRRTHQEQAVCVLESELRGMRTRGGEVVPERRLHLLGHVRTPGRIWNRGRTGWRDRKRAVCFDRVSDRPESAESSRLLEPCRFDIAPAYGSTIDTPTSRCRTSVCHCEA